MIDQISEYWYGIRCVSCRKLTAAVPGRWNRLRWILGEQWPGEIQTGNSTSQSLSSSFPSLIATYSTLFSWAPHNQKIIGMHLCSLWKSALHWAQSHLSRDLSSARKQTCSARQSGHWEKYPRYGGRGGGVIVLEFNNYGKVWSWGTYKVKQSKYWFGTTYSKSILPLWQTWYH